jgi:D-xylose transport system substrate-binding protein
MTLFTNPRILLVAASLVLSLVTGMVLSRGRGGDARVHGERRIRIGLSLDTLKEERWQRDRDFFVARAAELGAEVFVQSANSDDVRQVRDVETLLSKGVDVMVIAPHDATAMAKGVEAAQRVGVPVISYDRLIRDADVTLYLSFDNEKVGEIQARYILDSFKGRKARVVRIYGSKTDNNAFQFKAGQDRVLQPAIQRGEVEVVFEDWAQDWKPENAKKIVNAAITTHGSGIDAVLASNDGTAGGAIQALLEEKLPESVVVTGQDAELAACQRILAGKQAMTVYKPLHRLSRRAAEAAVALARGEPIIAQAGIENGRKTVPAILEEVTAVDRNNLRETVVKDGFHAESALK